MIVGLILAFSLNAFAKRVDVQPKLEMSRLLKAVDADGDKKITILDLHNRNSVRCEKSFWLQSMSGEKLEVEGTYYLSNLLQELKMADERGQTYVDGDRIFERPVTRISRQIRDFYWDNLTRRVDATHLAAMLEDSKIKSPSPRVVYVPEQDQMSYDYFTKIAKQKPELNFEVLKIARDEAPPKHGLLALQLQKKNGKIEGSPFVVPGGRFNEMYGWDSYFEGLGLIHDGKFELAKSMLENQLYEIENYGKVLNANRSYYYDRSQPPFITSYITEVYQKMDSIDASKIWLKRALATAIAEYRQVWTNADHVTDTGLSRYGGPLKPGIPPEVESGHFDFVFAAEAKHYHLPIPELQRRYLNGTFKSKSFDEFFAQDRAVRESGHDTTSRWTVNGEDRAADFVTVDLNSLLYKYELDIARLIDEPFGGKFKLDNGEVFTADEWRARAEKRKAAIVKYLWNPEAKMFFDYNFKTKTQSTFVSATGFYPFWAFDSNRPTTKILNDEDSKASMHALVRELEAAGGLLSTSKKSWAEAGGEKHPRQWDYPNGWAPHQMIAWKALKNFGEDKIAERLIYRWLYMITRNAVDYNGTIPEKFDVVKRSHAVFAEYGNIGTSFSYITREGFGWMNSSYQIGLSLLPEERKIELDRLRPPEWLD